AAAALAGPLLYSLLQAAQEELQRAGFPKGEIPAAVQSLAAIALRHATYGRGWTLLTGPLVRNDWNTVGAHREVLQPEMRSMYDAITAFVLARLSGPFSFEPHQREDG
ncbi:MAG: DUF2520 domain-containing protein, partial [Thermoanaerobaculum sp.]